MAKKNQKSDPQPLSSMTGFARQEGGEEAFAWTWEVKSVNNKARDLRCRLPNGYEALEEIVRGRVATLFARGSFQIALNLASARSRPALQINRDLLNQVVALVDELEGDSDFEKPRLDGLLGISGMLEPVEESPDEAVLAARKAALEAGLEAALTALAAARRAEGARIAEVMNSLLAEITSLVEQAGETAAAQPAALKARLREQVAALLEASPALPEERLAQEAALLATKADVREELDRLAAHIEGARELLAAGGAVGRRLDFLCQEFNREANTLCSKSSDMALTRIGLDLKSRVEQLREQVQNLE